VLSNYLVEENTVSGASDVGISIGSIDVGVPISNALCMGNTVESINLGVSPFGVNSATGIYVGDNGYATNVTVSGNYIASASYGITSSSAGGSSTNQDILISGNTIQSTTTDGIFASKTIFLRILANFIDISTGTALLVASSVTDASISGNQIRNENGAGSTIDIVIGAPNTQVSGNNVEGGGTSIYSVATTNIIGNTLLDPIFVGINLDTGSTGSIVDGSNFVYQNPGGCGYCAAVRINVASTTISNNHIVGFVGIWLTSSASNASIQGNDLRNSTNPISGEPFRYSAPTATGLIFTGNAGYNPQGTIASPFVPGGNYVLDAGGVAEPVNASAMTVWESPKNITVVIGSTWTSPTGGNAHTLVIEIDGTQIVSTNEPATDTVYTFNLTPGQTFYIQYQSTNSPVTFIVSGE